MTNRDSALTGRRFMWTAFVEHSLTALGGARVEIMSQGGDPVTG